MKCDCRKCPWFKIWVHPRETIREILSKNPKSGLLPISFLYGLNLMFYMISGASIEASQFVPAIILALILALPLGYALISFSSWLILLTGKIIRGRGHYQSIRTAVTWGSSTTVVNCILWVIGAIFLGSSLFSVTGGSQALAGSWAQVILSIGMLIGLIASFWGIYILAQGVGEVQGFSAWLGLLNVVLAWILISIALKLVGMAAMFLMN